MAMLLKHDLLKYTKIEDIGFHDNLLDIKRMLEYRWWKPGVAFFSISLENDLVIVKIIPNIDQDIHIHFSLSVDVLSSEYRSLSIESRMKNVLTKAYNLVHDTPDLTFDDIRKIPMSVSSTTLNPKYDYPKFDERQVILVALNEENEK